MAYHAGAELTGIECFQINPLIKDYNGPACAYVANPFGGYQVNRHGERFVDSDYWSGPDDGRVRRRGRLRPRPGLPQAQPPARGVRRRAGVASCTPPNAPPAAPSTRAAATTTAPTTSRCTSPRSACAAATRPRAYGSTTTPAPPCPGLYAAGDLACVPHNYMIGAFVFGDLAGADAAQYTAYEGELPADQLARGPRADLPAAAQPGRPAAAPGRVQAAPLRQRLRRPAQVRRPALPRRGALRADARRDRRDGRRAPRTS